MVWSIVASIAISTALAYFLAPKPKDAKPAGIDEFNVPTAEVGRAIPVLFGERIISGPNVVWYGDLRKSRIRQRAGFRKVTVGHRYYLGIHFILGHGRISLKEIKEGDSVRWAGNISILQSVMLDTRGSGQVDYEPGASDQSKNNYLQSQLGNLVPAYRGVTGLVFRQVYVGDSPYIDPWSFLARRVDDSGWQSGLRDIGVDTNPIHIIREVQINRVWGMGYSTSDINNSSYVSAAQTLCDEGFGLAFEWTSSMSVEEFIQEVLRHIDATMYVDRKTGLFNVKLIRPDYDIESIPVFDESNIVKIRNYKRKARLDLENTVSIGFWNRSNEQDDSYTISNTAMVADMGATVTASISYPGITSPDLAAFVAARDLRTLSSPLASVSIYCNRHAAKDLYPGYPIILSWPGYGIDKMVLRIRAWEMSDPGNNEIKLECVEDIFGVDAAVYSPVPPSGWTDPIGDPVPVVHHSMIEAPYYWLAREVGQADADAVGAGGHLLITGVNPGNGASESELWIDDGDGYYDAGIADFCPTATLSSAINLSDTVLDIESASGLGDVSEGSWALIDDEIIRVDSVGVSAITVARGCLDTVATAHTIGSRIYFASDSYTSTIMEYGGGDSINARLLTVTSRGTLPIGDASTQSLTFDSRAIRPYPPGRLRVNGEAIPQSLSGDLAITWRHRDRIQQVGAAIVGGDANTNIGPESGTEYLVEIRRTDTSALLHSESGLNGTSVTISAVDIGYEGEIALIVWSERGSHGSWQRHKRVLHYLEAE